MAFVCSETIRKVLKAVLICVLKDLRVNIQKTCTLKCADDSMLHAHSMHAAYYRKLSKCLHCSVTHVTK